MAIATSLAKKLITSNYQIKRANNVNEIFENSLSKPSRNYVTFVLFGFGIDQPAYPPTLSTINIRKDDLMIVP